MTPLSPQPKPSTKSSWTEAQLRKMLELGNPEMVQYELDKDPTLKFKIENNQLVDLITGSALVLKYFITEDPQTLDMKSDALKLSYVSDEVLITGETGTGKEIIARSMLGDRTGKFIAVNCAGLPENLIESELFGHAKGSFTGADSSKVGMLTAAKDGVLFLDEIGELPLSVQGKLLRALQEKRIRPVGANQEVEVSCRFVCATHRNLIEMVKENRFRQDLYARISTFELHIKPLKDRKKDIIPILLAVGRVLKIESKASEFIEKYKEQISSGELDLSLNVRSLERMLKRYNTLGKI